MNTDDYEGHTEGPWDADAPLGIYLKVGQTISAADARLIAAAPDLLAEVKRLRYLEKYEPAFQVYASIDDERNDDGDPIGEPMPELKHLSGSDEFHYIGFDSVKECEEYIADLPKGWWGHIEVIEWYEPAQNPQLKTLSEWQESEEE